jgi:TonB family protein
MTAVRPAVLLVVAPLISCASRTSADALVIIRSDAPVQIIELDSARVDSLRRAGVFLEKVVDQRPEVVMMGSLSYPDDLRRMGIQGRVVLQCIVGVDGRAEPGTVTEVSAVDPGFVFAAREALRTARFRPGKVGGRPVRTLVRVPFDFKLRGRSQMTRTP